jgi:hypothetical protein
VGEAGEGMTDMSSLHRDIDGSFDLTHGESDPPTPEYEAWHQMKSRCLNSKDKRFKDYGGRGIAICERWQNSYEMFLADMGRRPSPQHSLDRFPNNDGDYEPTNCRWATRSEQQQNKRVGILMNTNTSGVPGVSYYSQTDRWEAYHWNKSRKIRLVYFGTFDQAVAARKAWEAKRKITP